MKKIKLLSRIFYFMLVGFILADMFWYGKTGLPFVKSKYLLVGTISTALISTGFYVIYLIQAKKYKELKQFFLGLIISLAVIWLVGYLVGEL